MQFSYAVLALAAASTTFAATVATVKKDITAIDKATTALNKSIQGTDGTDQFADLEIDSDAQDLIKKIKKGTTDVKSLTKNASSADAKSIISTLTGTEKSAKAACTKLASDKAGYESAGVTSIVAADVKSLSSAINSFSTALLAKTPSSSQTAAKALVKKFKADLKICTDAYPSS